MMSPFYLMDYNARIEFAPSDSPRGVDVHPHKGFETVTIAYHGKIAHADSAGNYGVIGEGGVQWMTAGSGLLHKEFHEESFQKEGGYFQMVQLWVNLPSKHKSVPPRYQDIGHEDKGIFTLEKDMGKCFVIAGEYKGVQGPAKTYSPIRMLDIRLKKGGKIEVPSNPHYNLGLLVLKGAIELNESENVPVDHFVLFKSTADNCDVLISAAEDAIVLYLEGEPIKEPLAQYGPFLMNTSEELEEAIREFQSGKYGHLE